MHSTTAVLTNAPKKADEKSETIQKLKTKQSTAAVAMLLCSRLCGNPLSNGMRAQLGDERCRQKSTSKQPAVQPLRTVDCRRAGCTATLPLLRSIVLFSIFE
jgi:hypothetical protein